MEKESLLLTIAQIAVTLAGFSGLVVAIRGTPSTQWHPRDIWSLSWMFGASLGALFLALVPLALAAFQLSNETVWAVSGLVMFAFTVSLAVAMALSSHRLTRLGHRPRVRYFPMGATCLLLICGCLTGMAAAGLFPRSRIGLFVLGLIACLLVAALTLVVFLVMLARTAGRGS